MTLQEKGLRTGTAVNNPKLGELLGLRSATGDVMQLDDPAAYNGAVAISGEAVIVQAKT